MALRHSYRRGDVVLVSFPFSNASGQKERPAIVISTDDYHEEWNEVLVVAVTSHTPKTLRKTDCALQGWQIEGLIQTVVGAFTFSNCGFSAYSLENWNANFTRFKSR